MEYIKNGTFNTDQAPSARHVVSVENDEEKAGGGRKKHTGISDDKDDEQGSLLDTDPDGTFILRGTTNPE